VQFSKEDPAVAGADAELDLVAPPPKPVPVAAAATYAPTCPVCKNEVAPAAVICTRCGTNLKTGKQMATKVKGPGMEAGQVAAVAGKMALSMVVGFVAALVGAGIWIALIMIAGIELGIIAWAIGAGIGFLIGQINKDGGSLSGMAAAGFALLAILLPKGLLVLLAMRMGIPAVGVFGLFDILWVFLAVSSAYKLAARQD
jgi:hypothetical protein